MLMIILAPMGSRATGITESRYGRDRKGPLKIEFNLPAEAGSPEVNHSGTCPGR